MSERIRGALRNALYKLTYTLLTALLYSSSISMSNQPYLADLLQLQVRQRSFIKALLHRN